jgi:SNF2 family DNA or RNA helicase
MHNMWGGVVMCSLKPQLEGEFRGAIDPVMRRVPLDAVVHNLPDIVYERRDVTMSPKQAAAYRSMSDRLIAQLDTGVLVAASPLTAMLRMLQLSSSYGELDGDDVPGEDPAKLILTDPSSKLDAFMDEYMEGDFGDRSVVVFAVSRQLIEMLSARLDKAGVAHGKIVGGVSELNRQMSIDDFQEGKTKIILLTLSAGGTGITLTAGSVCVMLQRSWSMIEHKQALARCRRIGSEIHDTITHVDYVAPGTVEELVIAALDDKGIAMEDLVHDAELLRSALESVKQ